MNPEISKENEKPISTYDQIMGTVESVMKEAKGSNKKEYLISNLNNIYGKNLSLKIVSALPEDFFTEKKESSPQKTESKTTSILSGIKNLPDEEKEGKILEILENEYKVPKEKIEKFKISRNWKIFFEVGMIAIPVTIATLLINNKDKTKKADKPIEKKEISAPTKEDMKEEEKSINFNERFDVDTYNSLPNKGQEVYKYFAENDPTPGKSYQILDKESATFYIFGPKNEFIASFPAGFGKDGGDEPNTSKEYNQGKNTTPSGVYLLSNFALPSDIEEYGDLQFSLYGVSITGDKTFLGEHQTYKEHGELERRTKRLETETPEDNKFSDGCINIEPENVKNYIKKYFKGDYSEMLFVLQDKESIASGNTFDTKTLIEQIIPVMLEMASKEEGVYNEYLTQTKNAINKSIEEMALLNNEYNNLVKESKADKNNIKKQEKIENVKKEINKKKEEVGEGRKTLGQIEGKIKELDNKRQSIERVVLGSN